MSIQRLQARLRKGPWSFASKALVAWLALSLAAVLAPCCEGITSLLTPPAAHAETGPGHDAASHGHDSGTEHALCPVSPDDALAALPGGASPLSFPLLGLWVFIGLAAMALVARLRSSAGPPLPARSPLYLRLGRLLN